MQTPIQRRAVLAYSGNDNSCIYRDRSGQATDWADVSGTVHALPIDPLKMGKVGRGQIKDDDTQVILLRGARVIDAEQFARSVTFPPTWRDHTALFFAMVCFAGFILCIIYLCTPEPTFPKQETVLFPPVEPAPQYDYGTLEDIIRAGVKK